MGQMHPASLSGLMKSYRCTSIQSMSSKGTDYIRLYLQLCAVKGLTFPGQLVSDLDPTHLAYQWG